jgi:hypothetical protein
LIGEPCEYVVVICIGGLLNEFCKEIVGIVFIVAMVAIIVEIQVLILEIIIELIKSFLKFCGELFFVH